MTTKAKYICVFGGIFLVALSIAMIMMYVALDHNPMGEFYECSEGSGERSCHINWEHWIELGVLWFISSFVALLFIVGIVKFIMLSLKNKRYDR